MRRSNGYFLASWDFFLTMLGEKEELFPIAGMIFLTLEMRDLEMRDAILEELPLLISWGARGNLGIPFPLQMLVWFTHTGKQPYGKICLEKDSR